MNEKSHVLDESCPTAPMSTCLLTGISFFENLQLKAEIIIINIQEFLRNPLPLLELNHNKVLHPYQKHDNDTNHKTPIMKQI